MRRFDPCRPSHLILLFNNNALYSGETSGERPPAQSLGFPGAGYFCCWTYHAYQPNQFNDFVVGFSAMGRKERRAEKKKARGRAPVSGQDLFATGLAHHMAKRISMAQEMYERVIKIDPYHVDALCNLGVISIQNNELDISSKYLDRALQGRPKFPEALAARGNLLRRERKFDQAILDLRAALKLEPNNISALSSLGSVFDELGEYGKAIEVINEALLIAPETLSFHMKLARQRLKMGQTDKAIEGLESVLLRWPDSAEIHVDLGYAFKAQSRYEEALSEFDQALSLDSEFARAHYARGQALLSVGDFDEGWREYDWRWRLDYSPSRRVSYHNPIWSGEDLTGKSLLVYPEQGIGDTLQFLRFVPMVAEIAAEVFLEVPKSLERLVSRLDWPVTIIRSGITPEKFDFHATLMDLPRILGTSLKTIPAQIPYFKAGRTEDEEWAKTISADKGFRVGIVWAGNPSYTEDYKRSMDPRNLLPLKDISGISLYSLQVDSLQVGHTGMATSIFGSEIVDLSTNFRDYSDTALAISHLDLVISTDTSVCHLVGGMGCPIWTMLSAVSDWRWLMDRIDSPWYPTMRLFRQDSPDDWAGVIQRISAELATLQQNGSE